MSDRGISTPSPDFTVISSTTISSNSGYSVIGVMFSEIKEPVLGSYLKRCSSFAQPEQFIQISEKSFPFDCKLIFGT